MIETTLLTILIAAILLAWRHALKPAKRAWTALHWWERLLLVLCVAPVPGPLDELVGAWLIGRGLKRLRA